MKRGKNRRSLRLKNDAFLGVNNLLAPFRVTSRLNQKAVNSSYPLHAEVNYATNEMVEKKTHFRENVHH